MARSMFGVVAVLPLALSAQSTGPAFEVASVKPSPQIRPRIRPPPILQVA